MTPEDVAAHIFWVLPLSWLCLQYGLDMLLDDVVPMSRAQIIRRL